jgi:general secretion pathway protein A
MYNQFFGFTERPFRLVPDPAYLFLSVRHEEALAHLRYAVNEGEGFVEITGEVGTGKTLLCRTFLEQLDDGIESAYIFNPRLTALELIKAVNDEFGIRARHDGGIKDQIDALNAFLMEKKAQGKKAVLVIDEAQNLDIDVLEQIRLLSNLETTRSKLLQIILAGQPELGEKLDSHELRQLGQRITLSCRLRPLSLHETGDYIRHRVQVASRKSTDIFTRRAIKTIYRYSGGIPRLINIACDRALLCAYGYNRHKVSAAIADAAIAELVSRGEIHRRRAGGWSPQWPMRLGLVSILAGLLVLFFFQYDIHGLLAKRSANGLPMFQSEPPASKEDVGTPSDPSQAPTPETFPDVSSQELSEDEISEAEAVADASRPADSDAAASTEGMDIPDVAETFHPVASAWDDDDLDRFIPKNTPLAISHDMVSFADYLATAPAAASRRRALKTVLGRWGTDASMIPDITEIADDGAFFAAAAAISGLAVHPIGVDLDLIRGLNLCAIFAFEGSGDQGPVYLAAVEADARTITLDDGASGVHITVPDDEISRHGLKEIYVFWKNFYNYQGVIPFTAPGDAVVTLKLHLRDLGYDAIQLGPEYDAATRLAVERIQAGNGIPVDGFIGPLTKMVLYNKTRGLAMPRLRTQRPADGDLSASHGITRPWIAETDD